MNLRKFYVKPNLPKELSPLYELSYNIWSTWDKDADKLYRRIDSALFIEVKHNPVAFLHKLSGETLKKLSEDKGFLYELDQVYTKFKDYISFQFKYKSLLSGENSFTKDDIIAYISLEFGLHESISIYSGGLGILAGDYLKGASDLDLPMIGVGLLYKNGYFTQHINMDGFQEEEYIENQWYLSPIKEMKDSEGKPIILNVKIKNEDLFAKVWKIEIGNVPLFLLDTNIVNNKEHFRSITDNLYVSDRKKRIEQEILIGYGTLELFKVLNINVRIYHLNEGHSAFLITKRIMNLMTENKIPYERAYHIVRQSTLFTTHTSVIEGNEHFEEVLMKEYLESDIKSVGMDFEKFMAYGRINGSSVFWLPAYAIRNSKFTNGVSKLHNESSREMWKDIFPSMHIKEIPIGYVTNGVHLQSWLSSEMTYLFNRYLGEDYIRHFEDEKMWKKIFNIPDSEIWEAHKRRKEQLISFVRDRIVNSMKTKGVSLKNISRVSSFMNPDSLTIGFARRFAPYKRANLILSDAERLKSMLTDKSKPIQLIFAGKAHPADFMGKTLIKEILDFSKKYDIQNQLVFIEDYDINVARHLVQGVDVWLNTPIKPMEASGTSGMKAGMNGALNLSILDGWWPECYEPKNGWAINAGDIYDNYEVKKNAETNQIYELIKDEISELYYNKGNGYFSTEWVQMMKNSIYTIAKNFNMQRVLCEYLYKYYQPACRCSLSLDNGNINVLKAMEDDLHKIREHWKSIYFKDVFSDFEKREIQTSEEVSFDVYVMLDKAEESLFNVEIFYMFLGDNYKIVNLEFIERYSDNVAKFSGKMKVKGTGEQGINIRIKPRSKALSEMYPEFVKWFV